MNKKGFTLIELLAVIVILAVVMLIGVTAVLPLISKAQKNSLASEGLGLIDTGKTAYNGEQLATSELKLAPNESHCFSLEWLRNHNYYEKASDKYSGSVLIVANSSGKYDYYFWITNGTYHVSAGQADNYTVEDGPGEEMSNCGGFTPSGNGGSTPTSPYTGTAYRNNQYYAPAGSSIVPPTSDINVWVMVEDDFEEGFFDTEQECVNEINNLGWRYYSCIQKSGRYGGIGKYLTTIEDYMAITNPFYCAVGSDCGWDSYDEYYYTLSECENYSGSSCKSVDFPQEPFYLKHEVENNIIQSTKTCIYYNNREFCLSPGYWDTNSYTTVNKLRADMENTLGVSTRRCENSSNYARCDVGSLYCYIDSSGLVGCDGYGHAGCDIFPSGGSTCHGDYIVE